MPHLPRDRRQMPADRDVREVELVGDLFRGHSFAASLHHVGLTARELQLEPFDRRLLLRAAAQLVDEGADSGARDDRVAAQRDLDGADESARAERLGDEAVGAGPDRGEQRLVVELGTRRRAPPCPAPAPRCGGWRGCSLRRSRSRRGRARPRRARPPSPPSTRRRRRLRPRAQRARARYPGCAYERLAASDDDHGQARRSIRGCQGEVQICRNALLPGSS